LLLLTSVLFALQMTAVTPLSASTSSQHVENQQQASVEGVLAGAAQAGDLKRAVLFWNASDDRFYNSSGEDFYTSRAPPNAFGDRLERAFGERGIAYNVYLTYYTPTDARRTTEMVYRGQPSDNAVRSAKTVILTDDDRLYDHTGARTSTPLAGNFYAPDYAPDTPTYNVVRVEVVVWRI
jgi:hypothetical protein